LKAIGLKVDCEFTDRWQIDGGVYMGRLSRNAVVLVAAASLVGTGAYALASSTVGGTITVCVGHKSGALYRATKCAKRDKRLTWNNQGVPGPQGAAGSNGATGMQGPQGNPGTDGTNGLGIDALFGDGSDGNVTISSQTTLTRDMYYNNLTIAAGQTLNPGGYRIFVAGTLTLSNDSLIAANGNNASGTTGGDALPSGTLGGSGAGAGAPGNGAVSGGSVTNSLGGSGGTGDGAAASTATPPSASAGGSNVFESAAQALTGHSLDAAVVTGGAGGSAAANGSGAAGGSGGGVVMVAARTVTLGSGSAALLANGGPGASGASPGVGGGGGGGVVVVITTSTQPTGITLRAAPCANADGGTDGGSGFTDWLG
jgi:hypothetical protein